MVTQSRPNTPARWLAARDRAHANGVQVRQLAGSGQWIATSSSNPTVAYEVTLHGCECKAAQFGADPVCVHRAALREAMGLPVAPATPPQDGIGQDELTARKAQAARVYFAGGALVDPVSGEVLADPF